MNFPYLKIAFLIFSVFLTSTYGYANNCFYASPTKSEESFNINFGNVVVQRDMPIGSVLATVTTNYSSVWVACREAWTYRQELSKWKTLSSLGKGIYNTNLPGVGIQIKDVYWGVLPFDMPQSGSYNGPFHGYQISLIKTGEISSGVLDTGILSQASIANEFYFSEVVLTGHNDITSTACSVTTPNITVPLGQRKKSDFTGVGSTTSWQDFNIGLTCNPGTRINVRIDATADSSAGAHGVMQLDKTAGDMAATGVGIQMGYRPDNSLVQYGQEKFYWTSVYGDEIVQLRARYYQTAAKITAGEANGTATFTLTYK